MAKYRLYFQVNTDDMDSQYGGAALVFSVDAEDPTSGADKINLDACLSSFVSHVQNWSAPSFMHLSLFSISEVTEVVTPL